MQVKKLMQKNDKNSKNNKNVNPQMLANKTTNSKYEITKLSSNEFTHIIHISDIHIRPNERHTEYQHVFDKLYISIRKLKEDNINAIIIITGDIFDNVKRFEPEQFILCSNFFNTLCDIYPLLIIPGNHDIRDMTRLDTVSPSITKRDNLYYLLKTGIYEYGNVAFVASSLYDEKNSFIKRDEVITTKMCIALYHGTLDGSANSDGYIFKNDNKSSRFRQKNEFGGFDAVLLGDIHKMQSLTPTMWYAGSLVQQNHGETLRNHGYLLWDISDKNKITVKFNEIISDYGMVTLNIKDGEWINNNIELPKKVTIRCLFSNTIDSKLEEIINLIKEKNGVEILDWYSSRMDTVIYNNSIETPEIKTMNDPILRELESMSRDNIQKMIEIHKNYMKMIDLEKSDNIGYLWYPIKLEFENLFGYAGSNNNIINFKTGITTITAPNATGKTSIINILLFGIFGDLLYTGTKNVDILNNNENNGNLSMTICHGGTIYTIKKTLVRHKNSANPVVIKSTLTYPNDNSLITIEGDTMCIKMKNLFGSLRDFYKCNIINSRDQNGEFFYLKPKDQNDYLKNIFRLSYLNDLVTINDEKSKQISNNLKVKEGEMNQLNNDMMILTDNNRITVVMMENERKELEYKQNMMSNEIETMMTEHNVLQKIITQKELKIIKIIESEDKMRKIVSGIENKHNNFDNIFDVNELRINIAINKDKIDNGINDTMDYLLKKNAELEEEMKLIDDIDVTKLSYDDIYKQKCYHETELHQLKISIDEISDEKTKYGSNNDIEITKTAKELMEIRNKLQKYIIPSTETEKKIRQDVEKIKKQILKCENFRHNDMEKNALEKITSEISGLKKELEFIDTEIETKSGEIKHQMYPIFDCIMDTDEIKKKIDQLMTKIKKPYMMQMKTIIDMFAYNIKKKEHEQLTEMIDDLKQKTLTDGNIDTYINKIDNLCAKNRLLKSEFVETKLVLLNPIKQMLNGMKTNAIVNSRNELSKLVEKKMALMNDINVQDNIIRDNRMIDDVAKENMIINNENLIIEEQISMYKYHLVLNELKKIIDIKNEKNAKLIHLMEMRKYMILNDELTLKSEILEKIEHNKRMDDEISVCDAMLNKIKFNDLENILKQKKEKYDEIYTKMNLINKQLKLLKIKNDKIEVGNKIEIIKTNEKLLEEINVLEKKLEYEIDRQTRIEYCDKLNQLKENVIIENEILKIECQLKKITEDVKYKQKTKQDEYKKIINLENALDKIKKNEKMMINIKKQIIEMESTTNDLLEYGTLIGPKNLQYIIVKKEANKLEKTMNDILSKFTKYSIKIGCTSNQKIKIIINDGNRNLNPNLLSGYESLVLLTAFKRAVQKHMNSTKGKIYIMDESVEYMDGANFMKTLPELLKFVVSEYGYVLLISQRDVKHIECNEIKIIKQNNIAMIQ